ncbi:MAG: two-component sensor histidine kinase, partial [Roseiflexaceae bacterium]
MSVVSNIWRSLRAKLFLAHLLVIAVGVVTMVVAIVALAPTLFDRLVVAIIGPNATTMNGMMGGMQQIITQAFRAAMVEALLLSAGAATLAAVATSLFVSARIVTPLQRLLA